MAVDSEQNRVAIGSTDADIRMFSVRASPDAAQADTALNGAVSTARADSSGGPAEAMHDVLQPFGALASDATHRIAHLEFSASGAHLAMCSTGKCWQLWHRRPPQLTQKKLKRRQKRKREQDAKAPAAAAAADASSEAVQLATADEWEAVATWRPSAALRSFTLLPASGASAQCRVAGLLVDNRIAVASVTPVRPRLAVHY